MQDDPDAGQKLWTRWTWCNKGGGGAAPGQHPYSGSSQPAPTVYSIQNPVLEGLRAVVLVRTKVVQSTPWDNLASEGAMAESLEPNRIVAALMAALQTLTDIQDIFRVGWVGGPVDLWERVNLVKQELEQILEERHYGDDMPTSHITPTKVSLGLSQIVEIRHQSGPKM